MTDTSACLFLSAVAGKVMYEYGIRNKEQRCQQLRLGIVPSVTKKLARHDGKLPFASKNNVHVPASAVGRGITSLSEPATS
jgi:hypothetical protein